jgi:steroid 5-alpha reductase family enzyme
MTNLVTLLTTVSVVILLYMTLLYSISLIVKRTDIVDVGWGIGFILIALVSLLNQELLTNRMLLVFFLVLIWGIRLSLHIYLRNKGKKEDYRYAQFKKDWGKLFYVRSYFQIFLLQGLFMILISLPVILISSSTDPFLGILDYIGTALWLLGFLIEVLSDIQLNYFIELKKAGKIKKKFADIGLWKYSRHPNYFGEILQWWAIGIIAYSVPLGYLGVIGPVTITYLIVFVSGIPLLEKKFKKHPKWPEYVARTNKLVPLPKLEKLLPTQEK